MYTNKFKGATNTSTIVVLSILVAAVHVLGYEILIANDDVALKVTAASVTAVPMAQNVETETIVVTATHLPRSAE